MDDSHPFRSMSISHPIPEIKLFQTLTLEISTPRSRLWVWSKGNVIQLAQYHINSFRFHFTSIRPTIPEKQLFRNLTLKHPRPRSWVRSKIKVTYCAQYPTDALPFRFTLIGPTIPEIWPKYCLTLKKHNRNLKKKVPKSKMPTKLLQNLIR